ncbi:uncharacterized protein LOC132196260 [Neocloeon triangulifer]|uniref:uncharacterized protein LOC132196260 n=1 Tax=Neocloeon triangulifer TaxID=2078957 RepID=UPI00286F0B11|nr:uncharacterized protein LOC132196260 [Neocloeon triangulifer]
MLRLGLLPFLVVAAVLANDPKQIDQPSKNEETEFQKGLMTSVEATNENLKRLAKLFYEQMGEMKKLAEEQEKNFNATNQRLDEMAQLSDDRHRQGTEELKNHANETDRKLNDLDRLVKQSLENVKHVDQKLDESAALAKRQNQHFDRRFSSNCNLARSASLTQLSNGKQYLFLTTGGNWTQVRDRCAEKGLQMITLKNMNDHNLVWQKIKELLGESYYWVSARNTGNSGQMDYRWHDGSKLELNSDLWKDNANKTLGCVEMKYGSNNGKLSGETCNYSGSKSVCELPSECY